MYIKKTIASQKLSFNLFIHIKTHFNQFVNLDKKIQKIQEIRKINQPCYNVDYDYFSKNKIKTGNCQIEISSAVSKNNKKKIKK